MTPAWTISSAFLGALLVLLLPVRMAAASRFIALAASLVGAVAAVSAVKAASLAGRRFIAGNQSRLTRAISAEDRSGEAAAKALPGVLAVLTQDDVPDVRYGAFVKDRTLFAQGTIRFEGTPDELRASPETLKRYLHV